MSKKKNPKGQFVLILFVAKAWQGGVILYDEDWGVGIQEGGMVYDEDWGVGIKEGGMVYDEEEE